MASIVADGRLPSRQQEDPPQANTTTSSTIEGNFGMLTLVDALLMRRRAASLPLSP